jgi:protein gp37
MGKTSIEWTDVSWNPIVGCTEISPGCANCYAARLAATRLKNTPQYKGLATHARATVGDSGIILRSDKVLPRWTGEVRSVLGIDPKVLEEPLHWRKPRRIFVCDMGDLFHESVEHHDLVSIFSVMHRCQHHTFQILTKRADRMKAWFERFAKGNYQNVWAGVSVENQLFADKRIPLLLQTPAVAVRWISAEPLLGPLDLQRFQEHLPPAVHFGWLDGIDWLVCGGESGANARPMHPNWARSLRDQCQAAGVKFFFKQWGEYVAPEQNVCALHSCGAHDYVADGREHTKGCPNAKQFVVKVGKKKAGRLLDGREWSGFPQVTP